MIFTYIETIVYSTSGYLDKHYVYCLSQVWRKSVNRKWVEIGPSFRSHSDTSGDTYI